MKKVIIPLLCLILVLSLSSITSADDLLLKADRLLGELAGMPNAPRIVSQVRRELSEYRYRRSLAVFEGKRIIRKGSRSAGGVPTPIPKGSRPAWGVPTSVPGVPPAPVITYAFYSVTDDFEGPFMGGLNRDAAYNWQLYISWGDPTPDREYTNRHGGSWAQKISGHAPFRAGIYRAFSTIEGAPYQASVFTELYPLGNGMARLGVDPTCGTDPDSCNVIWSGTMDVEKDKWVELTNAGFALGNCLTVFLDAWNPLPFNTNIYFDDFIIELGSQAIVAYPTAIPTCFPPPIPVTGGVK